MPSKRTTPVKIPEGYRMIVSAELPDAWDFKKSPALQGTVQTIQHVKVTDKDGTRETRVAHVTNKDGTFGVWECATLVPFFDALKDGDDVLVTYEGTGEAKPGRSAPKLYNAFIK